MWKRAYYDVSQGGIHQTMDYWWLLKTFVICVYLIIEKKKLLTPTRWYSVTSYKMKQKEYYFIENIFILAYCCK